MNTLTCPICIAIAENFSPTPTPQACGHIDDCPECTCWWPPLHGVLDGLASVPGVSRLWSPEQTDECPVEDRLRGDYCESDAQLRERLQRSLRE